MIIKNESFPIGLSIGPSENKHLFNQFFSYLKEKDIDAYEKMMKLPALADEGVAIASSANEHNIKLYKCFRHLIEKFGASSEIGKIIRQLLFSKSEDHFKTNWNDFKDQVLSICDEKHQTTKEKFEKLFNCDLSNPDTQPSLGDQSLWMRAKDHVSTCSNHLESIHKQANAATRDCRAFRTKLKAVLEILTQRRVNACQRPNLKRDINHTTSLLVKHPDINVDKYISQNPMKTGLYGDEYSAFLKNKKKIDSFTFDEAPILIAPEIGKTQFTQWVLHDQQKMEFTITEQDKLYAENNGGIDQNRILDLFKTSICGEHFTDEAKIKIFIHFHMISQNRIVYVPSADTHWGNNFTHGSATRCKVGVCVLILIITCGEFIILEKQLLTAKLLLKEALQWKTNMIQVITCFEEIIIRMKGIANDNELNKELFFH